MAFSSAMLLNTIHRLERASIPSSPLLEGLVDESMLGQKFWLPDEDYFEVLMRAAQRSPHPAVGLNIGWFDGDWAGFGAAGLSVPLQRSFRDAVKVLVRYKGEMGTWPELLISEDEQTLTMQFGPFDAPLPARRLLAEVGMAAMSALLQHLSGPGARPLTVCLDYPEPRYAGEYSKLFGCPVQFDQPQVSLVVSRSLAEREKRFYRPELAEHLGRLADSQVTWARAAELRVADRVRSCVRRGLPEAASMSLVARELGVSDRSLRRHLAREGQHFSNILAQSRVDVAREMLRKGVAVKQIAGELGYRSTTAFHRAFRRWAGSTPAAYAVGERRSS